VAASAADQPETTSGAIAYTRAGFTYLRLSVRARREEKPATIAMLMLATWRWLLPWVGVFAVSSTIAYALQVAVVQPPILANATPVSTSSSEPVAQTVAVSSPGTVKSTPIPRPIVATFIINTTTDNTSEGACATAVANHCSLREAFVEASAAPPGSAITVMLPGGTYTLAGTLHVILAAGSILSVSGASAKLTKIDGNHLGAVMNVHSGNVTLTGVTITNGDTPNFAVVEGGGIVNSGQLTIRDSAINGNRAGLYRAGGIENSGTLAISGSAITGNQGGHNAAGGLGNNNAPLNSASMTVSNSTISGNFGPGGASGAGAGPGIVNGGILSVGYTTIAGNGGGVWGPAVVGNTSPISGNQPATFSGTIVANNGTDCSAINSVDNGYNLSRDGSCGFSAANHSLHDTDPLLITLADNRGATQTIALQVASPAIGAGGSSCPLTDQRGVTRPQRAACDIGAIEFSGVPATLPPSGTGTGSGTSTLPRHRRSRTPVSDCDRYVHSYTNCNGYTHIVTRADGHAHTLSHCNRHSHDIVMCPRLSSRRCYELGGVRGGGAGQAL
jgi:hypothetical protein